MRGIIFGLVLLASHSAVAMDAGSTFVQDGLTKGMQIIAEKSTTAQVEGLCALVKGDIDTKAIATVWLGDYATLSTDQPGVLAFDKLMPSLLVSKVMPMLSKASGGSFQVSPTTTDQGDGTFSVDVTLQSADGSSYDASMILEASGSSFKAVDVLYMGFSGVNYYTSTIQDQINSAAQTNPQTPVSLAVQQIMAAKGFVSCPN
jgi:hypothetical protein